MESYNQSINGSTSNGTSTEGVPLLVTYLIMVTALLTAIIVIIPVVTIINVIWQTRELHTKYFFFVAQILATNITWMMIIKVLAYLIIILYLLDLNSDTAVIILKWLGIAPFILIRLMAELLPITVAVERMIVIAFPFRHRSIMTTKTVVSVLAAMWGMSAILAITIVITVPCNIVWPLGLIHFHPTVYAIIGIPQLISIICIVAANSILQYKITLSNRKAAENQRLGNEEEVKKFKTLLQEVRGQAKATITLFIVCGIDVIANILQIVTFAAIEMLVEPNKKLYALIFSYALIGTCVFLSEIMVYGLYIKKIRNRLPNWMVCYRQWITRHNRVGILHQRTRAAVNNITRH